MLGNPLLLGGEGYQISRSMRLRAGASAYLSRTPTATTNRKTWTWSGWVKRGTFANGHIFTFDFPKSGNNGGYTRLYFNNDTLRFESYTDGVGVQAEVYTAALFRDVSAHYHIQASVDTTNATPADRVIIYVNGVRRTVTIGTQIGLNVDTRANLNSASHQIGRYPGLDGGSPTSYFDGYLSEVHFIDGQALLPTAFGDFDSAADAWRPKKYAGSYGTNGFYLPFSDNSAATAAAIGADKSGNGNNWTPNNISLSSGATYDSMLDVPTMWVDGGSGRGNYATLNPLDPTGSAPALTAGNLSLSDGASGAYKGGKATSRIPSFGKWYFEVTPTSFLNSGSTWFIFGLAGSANSLASYQGQTSGALSYGRKYGSDAYQISNETTSIRTDAGVAFVQGDVLQCAFDADAGKLWFGKNGAWYDASSGTTGDPAAGINQTMTTALTGLFPFVQMFTTAYTEQGSINFGQRPFSYSPPTGFKALHTGNISAGSITTSGSFVGNALAEGPSVYLNGVPTAMTINGNPVTFGTHADKTAYGFKVRSSSASYNAAGTNTFSVTTTGAKFKFANAQGNP